MAAEEQEKIAETVVWSGGPSQWMNLPLYLICIIFSWLVIPALYAIWKWIEQRFITFELTTERFRQKSGVFTRHTDELELYRIKDTELHEPLYERIFGLGTIILHTSDKTSPVIKIGGVKNAEALRQLIRDSVESLRKRRGVRELDMASGATDELSDSVHDHHA
jgi:uncharacterized membrane protein YdbT with pleckstrin-like domain